MRVTLRKLGLGIGFLWIGSSSAGSPDWLPFSADELKMTGLAQAPGATAVILYRQIDRNDSLGYEDVHVRIKVLTEDGRKYGDIQISSERDVSSVRDIAARTICPDGSIETFAGTVYDKPLQEWQGATVATKAFQLPHVEAGCILEYRYRIAWSSTIFATGGWGNFHSWVRAFNSQWILNAPLYTVDAKFSLVPLRAFTLRYSWPNGLPSGSAPPHREKDRVVMEVHDVAAFVAEEHMPPVADLMSRVDFIYSNESRPETDQTRFWKKFGVLTFNRVRDFVDAPGGMNRVLSQIVQPGDSSEERLRKIYARVQSLRNLEYLPPETNRLPGTRNVAEVWQRGAGDDEWDINWLFLALVRAAGFTADPVMVAARNDYRFEVRLLNAARLNGTAVAVRVGGSTQYFNPGVPYTPFGMLPWYQTDTSALRLDEHGGSWVTTPLPGAFSSRVERNAELTLSSGNLKGKLTVSYTGFEAAWRRLQERNVDELGRRQFLEKGIEAMIPAGAEVKLISSPDWSSADEPLVAQFELRIAGWATGTGAHELVPIGVFGAAQRHLFELTSRVHPLYFEYPRQYHDTVMIALPDGWQVDSVPADRRSDLKVLNYSIASRGQTRSVRVTRDLSIDLYAATAESYSAIRKFFESVRTGDEQQVVVTPETTQRRSTP